jgi:hypothetical protein
MEPVLGLLGMGWPLLVPVILGSMTAWAATLRPRRPRLLAGLSVATVIAILGLMLLFIG